MKIQPKREHVPPLRRTKQRQDYIQRASIDAKPRTEQEEVHGCCPTHCVLRELDWWTSDDPSLSH